MCSNPVQDLLQKVSIATHISTFTEHHAEKSVTIDPMHTQCTWYELYQIRIKRNK
jgi:hypothetical protein